MRITELTVPTRHQIFEGMDPRSTRLALMWENAGRYIKEARLSPDQVDQLFKEIVSDNSDNKEGASKAVKSAWQGLQAKAEDSGPVDGFDEKLDKLESKLAKTTQNNPKIKSVIDKYREFSRKYPAAQGVIYSALVATAGISAAGLGVGAALGLLALSDKLISASKDRERDLSEQEVNSIMESVVSEGAMDFMKNMYNKAKNFVTSHGQDDPIAQLKKAWVAAGSPTKTKAMKRFLKSQGISDPTIDTAIGNVTSGKTKSKTGNKSFGRMASDLSKDDDRGARGAFDSMADRLKGGDSPGGAGAFDKMSKSLKGDKDTTSGANAFGDMAKRLGGEPPNTGASAFGNMASSLTGGNKKGNKPHPGVSKAELQRRWVQFLKNNRIAGTQSSAKGDLNYNRQPTEGDVERFLDSEGEYTQNEIQSAIRHVSGATRLKTDIQKRVDSQPAPKQQDTGEPTPTTVTEPPESSQPQPDVKGADRLKADLEKKSGAAKPAVRSRSKTKGISDQIQQAMSPDTAPNTSTAPKKSTPKKTVAKKAASPSAAATTKTKAATKLSGTDSLKANIAKKAAVKEAIKDRPGHELSDDQIEKIFTILLRTRY